MLCGFSNSAQEPGLSLLSLKIRIFLLLFPISRPVPTPEQQSQSIGVIDNSYSSLSFINWNFVLALGQVHAPVKTQVTGSSLLNLFLCKVQYVHINPACLGGKSFKLDIPREKMF